MEGVVVTTSADKVEREKDGNKLTTGREENTCTYDRCPFSNTAKPVYKNQPETSLCPKSRE
jgi:hypothetical protein